MAQRITAEALIVEWNNPAPEQRLTAIALIVEWRPASPPSGIGEGFVCAPEVNSGHVSAPVAANAGPIQEALEVDSGHVAADTTAQTQTAVTTANPTHYSAQGISISIYQPTIGVGTFNPEGKFLRTLEGVTSGWTHTIGVDGGYISAQFAMNARRDELDDWIDNGLMRHIVVHNEANERIWEGFVNQVDVRIGPLSFSRGPVMAIANRVLVQYARLDTTLETPTVGPTLPGILADNTDSQALFGILEEILNGGTCTDEEADYYRDTYLYEQGWPQQSKEISIGGGSEASVTLQLLGYGALLEKYTYESDSILFITASEKIEAVLTADPNNVISPNYTRIADNAIVVPEGVPDDGKTALNVIKSVVELGDANDLPWTFGIYANRRAWYQPQDSDITYYQRLGDPSQQIRNQTDAWVRPWNVMPGKWLFIEDILVGYPDEPDLRKDPRALYIEEVTYTAPWGLQIRGSGGGGRLKQYLAKLNQASGR